MKRSADRTAWTLATWFGCGLLPAPGTIGTLGAVPLYWLASRAGAGVLAGVALAVAGAGVWSAGVVAKRLASNDPHIVVIDEVAGFLITMLGGGPGSWVSVTLGFGLFRLLDIAKPWPIHRLERLPGGWGIVLDDIAAGALGALALMGLRTAGVIR